MTKRTKTARRNKLFFKRLRIMLLPYSIRKCRSACLLCKYFPDCYREIFKRDWWE